MPLGHILAAAIVLTPVVLILAIVWKRRDDELRD